ncbi:MAG: hypothetical protein ACK559_38360, partial [bacterium]
DGDIADLAPPRPGGERAADGEPGQGRGAAAAGADEHAGGGEREQQRTGGDVPGADVRPRERAALHEIRQEQLGAAVPQDRPGRVGEAGLLVQAQHLVGEGRDDEHN